MGIEICVIARLLPSEDKFELGECLFILSYTVLRCSEMYLKVGRYFIATARRQRLKCVSSLS